VDYLRRFRVVVAPEVLALVNIDERLVLPFRFRVIAKRKALHYFPPFSQSSHFQPLRAGVLFFGFVCWHDSQNNLPCRFQ
jgi:hypothetical protein